MGCGCNKGQTNMQNEVKASITEQVASVTKAVAAVITGNATPCPENIIEERLKICAECDNIARLNQLPKGAAVAIGDRCGECGCYLKGSRVTNLFKINFSKVAFIGKDFVCPLEKWGYEFGKFDDENEKDLSNESEETN